MKHRKFIAFAICILIAICVLAGFFVRTLWKRAPFMAYEDFVSRETNYFSEVSAACDVLIGQTRSNAVPRGKVAGNQFPLPGVLKEFHPASVDVDTNHVYLVFGDGRLAWAIIWQQDDIDESLWTLLATSEGHPPKPVYSVQKPTFTP